MRLTKLEVLILIRHGMKLSPEMVGHALVLMERGLCDYHSNLHHPEKRTWVITRAGEQVVESMLDWIDEQPYDESA